MTRLQSAYLDASALVRRGDTSSALIGATSSITGLLVVVAYVIVATLYAAGLAIVALAVVRRQRSVRRAVQRKVPKEATAAAAAAAAADDNNDAVAQRAADRGNLRVSDLEVYRRLTMLSRVATYPHEEEEEEEAETPPRPARPWAVAGHLSARVAPSTSSVAKSLRFDPPTARVAKASATHGDGADVPTTQMALSLSASGGVTAAAAAAQKSKGRSLSLSTAPLWTMCIGAVDETASTSAPRRRQRQRRRRGGRRGAERAVADDDGHTASWFTASSASPSSEWSCTSPSEEVEPSTTTTAPHQSSVTTLDLGLEYEADIEADAVVCTPRDATLRRVSGDDGTPRQRASEPEEVSSVSGAHLERRPSASTRVSQTCVLPVLSPTSSLHISSAWPSPSTSASPSARYDGGESVGGATRRRSSQPTRRFLASSGVSLLMPAAEASLHAADAAAAAAAAAATATAAMVEDSATDCTAHTPPPCEPAHDSYTQFIAAAACDAMRPPDGLRRAVSQRVCDGDDGVQVGCVACDSSHAESTDPPSVTEARSFGSGETMCSSHAPATECRII
ncbi:hypothetical protein NESM_000255500 [Novymonas esmeraldas]|uniref:Membrane-associated protein n=1 Tax=Novymonas esmeraldas TaxID=1808958 RepID=A0AAW0FA40_9TRYP